MKRVRSEAATASSGLRTALQSSWEVGPSRDGRDTETGATIPGSLTALEALTGPSADVQVRPGCCTSGAPAPTRAAAGFRRSIGPEPDTA